MPREDSSERSRHFFERHPWILLGLVKAVKAYQWYSERFHTCSGCGETKDHIVPYGRVCINRNCRNNDLGVSSERIR